VIAVATRLPAALMGDTTLPLVPPEEWRGTELVLPRPSAEHRWRDALTGAVLGAPGGEAGDRLPLAEILARLPVALLEVG
jgi:(1->4)-alpha-D-glucan 1-alpha-D-glucosylmutase